MGWGWARPAVLAMLSDATGGQLHQESAPGLADIELTRARPADLEVRRETPRWNRTLWLLVLAFALGGEWIARRRLGLL